MIYCLTISHPIVGDNVRDDLLVAAYQMVRSGEKRRKFRSQDSEGEVKTSFERAQLGGLVGYVFHATVECDPTGQTIVTYLVRDQDLRRLEEVDECAWLTQEQAARGEIPQDDWRENPIRRVAHGNN